MYSICTDIIVRLIEHGITKIIFINGHNGNTPIIDNVAWAIKRKHGIMIGKMDLWQSISPAFRDDLYGKEVNPLGHGGEPLTSVMKYFCSEHSRIDLLETLDQTTYMEKYQCSRNFKSYY